MDMKVTSIAAAAKAQFLAETLKEGEHYAGLILGKNGEPDYHLVVVAITETEADWKAHTAWAKKARGEMPTRRELNLLRANLRELFASTWYWSSEVYEGNSAYAWFQNFTNGRQTISHKGAARRAVAVRRLFL